MKKWIVFLIASTLFTGVAYGQGISSKLEKSIINEALDNDDKGKNKGKGKGK